MKTAFPIGYPGFVTAVPVAPFTHSARVRSVNGSFPRVQLKFNEATMVVGVRISARTVIFNDPAFSRPPNVDDFFLAIDIDGKEFFTLEASTSTSGSGQSQNVIAGSLDVSRRFLMAELDKNAPTMGFKPAWAYDAPMPGECELSFDVIDCTLEEWRANPYLRKYGGS